jgi:Uma2 family endonuclease
MSAIPKRKLTAAEYLEIERAAEFRSEFFDGEMFAMAGASYQHNIVKDSLVFELRLRLLGSSCRTSSSDQRVRIDASGLYVYPDIVIVCGEPEFAPQDPLSLVNPRIIIEVLSDSTEPFNRQSKFHNYMKLPSVEEYILVLDYEPLIMRYERRENDEWRLRMFHSLAETFSLATIPAEIPMADLYRNVTFPPAETARELP